MSSLRAVMVGILVYSTLSGGVTAGEMPGDDVKRSAASVYTLNSLVSGAGGTAAESPTFSGSGTLAQPVSPGSSVSSEHAIISGFWAGYNSPTAAGEPTILLRNRLLQNYPNPFNPSTTISFSVAVRAPVELAVFNVRGRRITTLVRDERFPGRHQVVWQGTNGRGETVATGVYFYRLTIGDSFTSVKKMLLLK